MAPDLVGRRFIANRPDQLWCGDVTYIDTDEGWLYLATVLDLCSRRLLGYAMADTHDAALTDAALRMAVVTRAGEGRTSRGVVFHSDRGSQGGFNRSSQHLVIMEVFDGAAAAAGGPGVATGDAFAWEADPGPACGARVLASDRAGQAH